MQPYLIIDNSVDGAPEALRPRLSFRSGRRFLKRLLVKAWAFCRLTELSGFLVSGTAFILTASLIYHLLPSDHPTFQDRHLIGTLIGVFGLGLFYLAGRRNLLAVPIITGMALLAHQYITVEVAWVPFIGRDVVLYSVLAVITGGLVRMITPTYELIE